MKKLDNSYGITRYELLIENGRIVLRFHATHPSFVKGYCNIESHPFKTGKSLPSLRTNGEKKAKLFGVPFVDKTI